MKKKTYKDLGYGPYLDKGLSKKPIPSVDRGDGAGGDLKGRYPRPSVKWENAEHLELSGGTVTGEVKFTSTIKDSLDSVGTATQVLTSSGSAIEWADQTGGAGGGDVTGPTGAENENIAVFNGTTGKVIKDGAKTIVETLARTNHTGTQTASTISDFDTEVGNNSAVAANTDKNTYPSADATKLAGIEDNATADQTGAEIKTAYEAEVDTNAYTDVEKTKLSGVATGAEVNVNADWNSGSGDSQILNKPSIPTVDDTAYNATSWDANTDASTKNAIRDKVETMDTAIGLNTAKETNSPTALSIGTVNATTYGITSDGGADDIVLPEANTDSAGLLGADKWDEIVANTVHKSSDGSDHSKVTANETAVALNTTHRSSDGSDHSKVTTNETAIALNTTHKSSSGTDHSDVVSNTTHRGSDGSDHSKVTTNETAIGLNTTHRSSSGADHTYINQSVISGSSPTFDGANISGVPVIDKVGITIDGGGGVISTGIKGDIEVPYGCTINQVTMLADQSGSIVIDIWKDTYVSYPPTAADTITASAKPTISSAIKSQDSTLTGWTTAVTAGNVLRYNVDSCTSITRCTLILKVTK